MIYDIVLNFKNIAYEFYEWESSDKILNIKEIIAYKVDQKTIFDFYYSNVLIDHEILKKIENKTKIFYNRGERKIKYACILYDERIALAFLFNSKGKVIGKSKLIYEESDEIINNKNNNELTKINYKVLSSSKIKNYRTRKELSISNTLCQYINKIYTEEKYDELNYMYFELFEKSEKNNESMFNKLKEKINNSSYKELKKILSLIQILKK